MLLFASAAVVRAENVSITTIDGRTVKGELSKWSADRIELSSDGGTSEFAAKELLEIKTEQQTSIDKVDQSSHWIEFSDGSRIPFTTFLVKKRIATINSPLSSEPLRVPADRIRFVQFTSTNELNAEGLGPDLTGDVLIVTKKDTDKSETLAGVMGDITAEQVEFTWEGDAIPVKMSKVAAIGFYQAEGQDQQEPLCELLLSSGSRLQVQSISFEQEQLEVSTVSALKLTVPLAEVAKADYSVGKLTYLSDLEPLKSHWTPLIALPTAAESIQNYGQPRRDMSYMGSPLSLIWTGETGSSDTLQTYNKGLALRSRTELEYRIPKKMRRFVATAGIDPETVAQGNVHLRIEVDGQVMFDETIDGSQPPASIDLDIAGKQRLKIFVDYGENLDFGDRLHLAEARLIK